MRTGETRPVRRPAARGRTQGFTYLWLLFALALGGVALAALGEQESTRQQREREIELRFRGEAIATALSRYADATPVGHLPLPQRLDDLLADRRHPTPRRHLRQLYTDPFTGQADWELVLGRSAVVVEGQGAASAPTGSGIVAVRSRSSRRLFATAGHRETAHDWVFASPAQVSSTPGL